jgi:hypothetical protein
MPDVTSDGRTRVLTIVKILAANMLISNSMNVMFLEMIVGMLVFAAGNVAYFEIRRLINCRPSKFERPKLSRAQTPRHATLHTSDFK